MKVLRYLVLAVLLGGAVMVAFANRAPVTLALWPDWVSAFVGTGYSVTAPLFAVIGVAVGLGLVIGLVWEWLRERGYRAEAAALRHEVDRLRAQLPASARGAGASAAPSARDDVLAILDERPSA